jgi:hypothetical protein
MQDLQEGRLRRRVVSEPFQIRPQNLAEASKNPCMLFFVVVWHTEKLRGTNTGSRKGKKIYSLSGALRATRSRHTRA